MRKTFRIGVALLPLGFAACADAGLIGQASAPGAEFSLVSSGTKQATGASGVWAQSTAEVAANEARARALVHQKTIGPDTAVQVVNRPAILGLNQSWCIVVHDATTKAHRTATSMAAKKGGVVV